MQTSGDLGRSWTTSGADGWAVTHAGRTGADLTPSNTSAVAKGQIWISSLEYEDEFYNYDLNFTDFAASLPGSVVVTVFMLLLRCLVLMAFSLKWALL